jgi:hypothetical protein
MKLIKGQDLTPRQSEQVLCAFVYRWTTGNCLRESAWKNMRKPTIPLQSDHDWLNDRAFWFLNDGSRLALNRKHAEPVYMAD